MCLLACQDGSMSTVYSSSTASVAASAALVAPLKSKQCALMLANLDYANIASIVECPLFRLSILRDCLLLGAQRTQLDIDKLPDAGLRRAASQPATNKDFMHPLWLAASQALFRHLEAVCVRLPPAPHAPHHGSSSDRDQSSEAAYESRLDELSERRGDEFELVLEPLTHSINAYLSCLHKYTCMHSELTDTADNAAATNNNNNNNMITFVLFQLSYVAKQLSGGRGQRRRGKRERRLSVAALNDSLLCVLNMLLDVRYIIFPVIIQN